MIDVLQSNHLDAQDPTLESFECFRVPLMDQFLLELTTDNVTMVVCRLLVGDRTGGGYLVII